MKIGIEEFKSRLAEFADVVNAYKSESVQEKIIDAYISEFLLAGNTLSKVITTGKRGSYKTKPGISKPIVSNTTAKKALKTTEEKVKPVVKTKSKPASAKKKAIAKKTAKGTRPTKSKSMGPLKHPDP